MAKAAVCLAVWGPFGLYAQPWIHLASPNFDVYADAGEGAARGILEKLEQIQQTLEAATHLPVPRGPRVRVIIFGSPSEFPLYAPAGVAPSVAGFYRQGPTGADLVIRDSSQGFSATVLHEYTHHFLHSTRGTIPLWYDEGFSELISHGGEPIPARVAELRRGNLLSRAALASVNHTSPEYHEADKIDLFYSESWALVHMLHTSSAYASELARLLNLLFTGTPALEAFHQVYRKTGEQVLAELAGYIAREPLPAAPLQLLKVAPVVSQAARLTRVESSLILTDLLIDVGRVNQAERMLRKLARAYPDTPAIEIALGDVDLASDRRPQAMAHYQRAIDSGTQDVRAYVELASLTGDEAAIPLLEKAAVLDPGCRDSRELLQSIRERKQPAEGPASVPRHPGDVITPKTWENPRGDSRVEGRLVWLDCDSSPATLHVTAAGHNLALIIGDPHQIVIRNAPGLSTDLRCGEMDRPATVEYRAGTGEITAIELR